MVLGVSLICFTLALTNLFLREGLFLYAITGGSGKILFSVLLFLISFQCFLIICFSLCVSSQKCVTKTNFLVFCVAFFLNRVSCIFSNLTELIWGTICLCL